MNKKAINQIRIIVTLLKWLINDFINKVKIFTLIILWSFCLLDYACCLKKRPVKDDSEMVNIFQSYESCQLKKKEGIIAITANSQNHLKLF